MYTFNIEVALALSTIVQIDTTYMNTFKKGFLFFFPEVQIEFKIKKILNIFKNIYTFIMIVCNPVNRNMYKSKGYRVHVGCVMTNNNVSGDIL